MHKKLDLENTRIKNINIIYRMAKRTVTRHRRKLRNNKSRSKRRMRGGEWKWSLFSPSTPQPQYQQQNFDQMSTQPYNGNPGSQSMNDYDRYGKNSVVPAGMMTSNNRGMLNTGGKRRRPRRSARKVKRSLRKGRKSRRTRRMRGGSNGYTINGAGIGKYTSALANPIPFSGYPLNR